MLDRLLPKSQSTKRFWDRFEQARFLMQSLNDNDIASKTADLAVSLSASNKLEACCNIYLGLANLTCKAAFLSHRGFELSEQWLQKLESLNWHFTEHLVSKLYGDDFEHMANYMSVCSHGAAHAKENLYAYASKGGL